MFEHDTCSAFVQDGPALRSYSLKRLGVEDD
jgi:hypothetical protein